MFASIIRNSKLCSFLSLSDIGMLLQVDHAVHYAISTHEGYWRKELDNLGPNNLLLDREESPIQAVIRHNQIITSLLRKGIKFNDAIETYHYYPTTLFKIYITSMPALLDFIDENPEYDVMAIQWVHNESFAEIFTDINALINYAHKISLIIGVDYVVMAIETILNNEHLFKTIFPSEEEINMAAETLPPYAERLRTLFNKLNNHTVSEATIIAGLPFRSALDELRAPSTPEIAAEFTEFKR